MPLPRQRSVHPRGLIAAVLLTALVGSVGMEVLGGMMRNAQGIRMALGEVASLVHRHSSLEWQAVATGAAEGLESAFETNSAALSDVSNTLLASAHDDPDLTDLVVLVGRYDAAVETMTDLLRQGEFERAEAIDAELVDPL